MNKKNILVVNNLSLILKKNGRAIKLLNNINFSVHEGQILGVVGESGSGKTLTMLAIMKILSCNIEVESGNIIFMDQDLLNKSDGEMKCIRSRDIFMIFQSQRLSLSPIHKISTQMKDIIKVHKRFDNRELNEYCLNLLHQVGFDNVKDVYNKYPFEISGGMIQRVMLAIVISMAPKLFIADEPTTALDADVQNHILSLIKRFQKQLNNSIIIVTHDFSIVKKICTDVIVMKNGEIIEKNTVKNILENPQSEYTKQLMNLSRWNI